jgi:2-oxoglutarate ferredoxin oxidoreductase subunit alpha
VQEKNRVSKRHSIKIAGASGQGINSVGEIMALALKRAGFYVFAYREYPSLIKGGHATYQIDFDNHPLSSSQEKNDLILVLNAQDTRWHIDNVKDRGIILHAIDEPKISEKEQAQMQEKELYLQHIPAKQIAEEVGDNKIMMNTVTMGYIWRILGLEKKILEEIIKAKFDKSVEIQEANQKCLTAGYEFNQEIIDNVFDLPGKVDTDNNSVISGNESLGLGAIRCGVSAFYAYPMTPASSILNYLANTSKDTGMFVKQVDDEIAAAAMTIGSSAAGARAFTATSGGGFDLMTEHLSYAGIAEVPFVCVIAQRPGPATGVPTWTAQGDLSLAVGAGHGEFPRCVMAISDAEDAFYTIQEAFNIAEKYQMPVLVLTDKHIAESYYTIGQLDQDAVQIDRGDLIDIDKTTEDLENKRYEITASGVSPRWFPGQRLTTYNSNSDEHDEFGNSTEEASQIRQMYEKRMRKIQTLKSDLPEPELFFNSLDLSEAQGVVNLIGWGSTLGVVRDAMKYFSDKKIKVNYLDIKYLWPLRTERISEYLGNGNPDTLEKVILIEGNHDAQLAKLIKQETGIDIPKRILKYDGRPFFLDEVIKLIEEKL